MQKEREKKYFQLFKNTICTRRQQPQHRTMMMRIVCGIFSPFNKQSIYVNDFQTI